MEANLSEIHLKEKKKEIDEKKAAAAEEADNLPVDPTVREIAKQEVEKAVAKLKPINKSTPNRSVNNGKRKATAGKKKVFPGGVLVYTQSYFEFVRLRNFFKQENLSFCLLSEYTDERNVHRARAWFFQNRRRIMLYSERSHFYHRYRIRGIREVIFYSLRATRISMQRSSTCWKGWIMPPAPPSSLALITW
ncbi:unnamed protein product, partial [Closterium sp. Naga37s-1]